MSDYSRPLVAGDQIHIGLDKDAACVRVKLDGLRMLDGTRASDKAPVCPFCGATTTCDRIGVEIFKQVEVDCG